VQVIHKPVYDRLKAERDRRYGDLLVAARANGPVAQAVVELHVPAEVSQHYPTHPECLGCFGTAQGSGPWWPDDCDTTKVIAERLGVDLT
jgi:hypothetical protein